MTFDPVFFPDAVDLVCAYLTEELAATVVPRVPQDRPAEFILVRRVGGVRRDIVTDEATLVVEAWAATDEAAHDLAQQARGYLHVLRGRTIEGVAVYGCAESAGPALLPDPESRSPRYTQTIVLRTRGSASA